MAGLGWSDPRGTGAQGGGGGGEPAGLAGEHSSGDAYGQLLWADPAFRRAWGSDPVFDAEYDAAYAAAARSEPLLRPAEDLPADPDFFGQYTTPPRPVPGDFGGFLTYQQLSGGYRSPNARYGIPSHHQQTAGTPITAIRHQTLPQQATGPGSTPTKRNRKHAPAQPGTGITTGSPDERRDAYQRLTNERLEQHLDNAPVYRFPSNESTRVNVGDSFSSARVMAAPPSAGSDRSRSSQSTVRAAPQPSLPTQAARPALTIADITDNDRDLLDAGMLLPQDFHTTYAELVEAGILYPDSFILSVNADAYESEEDEEEEGEPTNPQHGFATFGLNSAANGSSSQEGTMQDQPPTINTEHNHLTRGTPSVVSDDSSSGGVLLPPPAFSITHPEAETGRRGNDSPSKLSVCSGRSGASENDEYFFPPPGARERWLAQQAQQLQQTQQAQQAQQAVAPQPQVEMTQIVPHRPFFPVENILREQQSNNLHEQPPKNSPERQSTHSGQETASGSSESMATVSTRVSSISSMDHIHLAALPTYFLPNVSTNYAMGTPPNSKSQTPTPTRATTLTPRILKRPYKLVLLRNVYTGELDAGFYLLKARMDNIAFRSAANQFNMLQPTTMTHLPSFLGPAMVTGWYNNMMNPAKLRLSAEDLRVRLFELAERMAARGSEYDLQETDESDSQQLDEPLMADDTPPSAQQPVHQAADEHVTPPHSNPPVWYQQHGAYTAPFAHGQGYPASNSSSPTFTAHLQPQSAPGAMQPLNQESPFKSKWIQPDSADDIFTAAPNISMPPPQIANMFVARSIHQVNYTDLFSACFGQIEFAVRNIPGITDVLARSRSGDAGAQALVSTAQNFLINGKEAFVILEKPAETYLLVTGIVNRLLNDKVFYPGILTEFPSMYQQEYLRRYNADCEAQTNEHGDDYPMRHFLAMQRAELAYTTTQLVGFSHFITHYMTRVVDEICQAMYIIIPEFYMPAFKASMMRPVSEAIRIAILMLQDPRYFEVWFPRTGCNWDSNHMTHRNPELVGQVLSNDKSPYAVRCTARPIVKVTNYASKEPVPEVIHRAEVLVSDQKNKYRVQLTLEEEKPTHSEHRHKPHRPNQGPSPSKRRSLLPSPNFRHY